MSLINKMLQDLERRGENNGAAGALHGYVRVTSLKQKVHPAWWLVATLVIALISVWAWIAFRSPPENWSAAPSVLPLKLESRLSAPIADGQRAAVLNAAIPSVQSITAASLLIPAAEALPTTAPVPPPALASVSAPVTAGASDPAPTRIKSSPLAAAPANLALAEAARIELNKELKELSPAQRAENEFRKATTLIHQGRAAEAMSSLEQALQMDSAHAGARQTLVGLMMEAKRGEDAMRVAQEGLQLDTGQPGLAMVLARLQLDRGDLPASIETLQRSLPAGGERADYRAFLAALFQRANRHREAVEQYAAALRKVPRGTWWMGMGLSLEADNRPADAEEAFNRAKSSGELSAELIAFVDLRLAHLRK
ncbi:MAG: tetratricopeptide repeat protein [Paucimonas sp.]|nr:tetratricopeptide repeat protein [Paucimonas sp.]